MSAKVKRLLRHSWWAFTHTGPYSDYARGRTDGLRVHRDAAAEAYKTCADQMERWADLTVARGGKPDWSEFFTILTNWHTSARYLREDQ